jgi:hypothetical protein
MRSIGFIHLLCCNHLIVTWRCRWYHGILSKTEAESVLRTRAEGTYLVRTGRGSQLFSLAIKSARGFIHLRVSKEEAGQGVSCGYRLGDTERTFPSLVDMVKHYSLNRWAGLTGMWRPGSGRQKIISQSQYRSLRG